MIWVFRSVLLCGTVVLFGTQFLRDASSGMLACSDVAGLVASSDLILHAGVAAANLGGRFGVSRLTAVSVWYEHPDVHDVWGRPDLHIQTRDELTEGEDVVAFVEYDRETTKFFASVAVLSKRDTVVCGHAALVGLGLRDLRDSVEVYVRPIERANLIEWAELAGLGEVEKCHLSGLSDVHEFRVCETWHGHIGADAYWDGRSLLVTNREQLFIGTTIVFFVRYNRNSCAFESAVGVVADGSVSSSESDELDGVPVDALRQAVLGHARRHEPNTKTSAVSPR